jgi:AmiR/NasT family two-component response regulator
MRLRTDRLGALNLLANETHGLVPADEISAQAMADVATIGILHERFLRQHEEVTEQLQVAFNSRVVLEQAKGVVAEASRLDMDTAFSLLRGYARRHNLLLSEVARRVISRDLAVADLEVQASVPRTRRR